MDGFRPSRPFRILSRTCFLHLRHSFHHLRVLRARRITGRGRRTRSRGARARRTPLTPRNRGKAPGLLPGDPFLLSTSPLIRSRRRRRARSPLLDGGAELRPQRRPPGSPSSRGSASASPSGRSANGRVRTGSRCIDIVIPRWTAMALVMMSSAAAFISLWREIMAPCDSFMRTRTACTGGAPCGPRRFPRTSPRG